MRFGTVITRRRVRVPALAVMAVLAALAGSLVSAAATTYPQVTRDTQVTKSDKSVVRNDALPAVAVDPKDSNHIAVVEGDIRTGHCALYISTDGGQTFKASKQTPNPTTFDTCTPNGATNAYGVAYNKAGNLVVGMLATNRPCTTNGNGSVVVAQTPDNGNSWSSTVVQDDRGSCFPANATSNTVGANQVQVAVDSKSNHVYVAYGLRGVKVPPYTTCTATSCSGTEFRLLLAASSDGGATFGKPIDVLGDQSSTPSTGSGPELIVGPDGKVYVFYTTSAPPKNATPPLSTTTPGMYVAISSDGGQTFTRQRIGATPPFYHAGTMTVAKHGSGTAIVVAYETLAAGTAGSTLQLRDIYTTSSFDGGQTWNPQVRVTDDDIATDLGNKYVPGISAAPNGRIDIAWADFRNDTGDFLSDAYYAYSNDGGQTWSRNYRLSSHSSNRHFGQFDNYSDIRNNLAVTSDNYGAYVAWDDTRNAHGNVDAQDIYFDAVQQAALPTPTKDIVVRVIASVIGGLIFAALVLLTAGLIRRTRRRSTVAAGTREGSAPS